MSDIKDKRLLYAVIASLAAHLCAVCVMSRMPARSDASAIHANSARMLAVDFVGSPEDNKPAPVVRTKAAYIAPQVDRQISQNYTPADNNVQPSNSYSPGTSAPTLHRLPQVAGVRRSGPRSFSSTTTRPAGNPGGRLNIGSTSANGDLGGFGGGRTPVGWVSGSDSGHGIGSGSGEGVGTPEPPRHAVEGPSPRPEPAPAPPPAPRTITIRVCSKSGLLPGRYCESTRSETFIEGREPRRTCDECKAPEPEHKSRLADQEKPLLVRDAKPSIPSSVEEGLSVEVEVEYTVTTDGDVSGVHVSRSSGERAIDRAVVRATENLKYKPAVQDGVPRSVKMTRTYRVRT